MIKNKAFVPLICFHPKCLFTNCINCFWMCRVTQQMQRHMWHTPIPEHTPLTLRVKTTVFLFYVFPSLPFLRHVRMTMVFCIFSVRQPENVSQCLHTASLWIDLAGLQRSHWLTGSSRDERRCHRKTSMSVCECEKSTPLLYVASAAFHLHISQLVLAGLFL